MGKQEQREYKVYGDGVEFTVTADRFIIEDRLLVFLSGTDQVAAFATWEAVI